MARFFVSGPLGFEKKLHEELQSVWFLLLDLDGLPTRQSFPEMTEIEGGLEFDCDLHLGLQINIFSKIAHRVLLRINRFSARYYDQLEKNLAKLDLGTFIRPPMSLGFRISTAKSRVNNEKNVLEVCEKIFKSKGFAFKEEPEQTLFIRIFKDEVEISIDSSGEHLHKRGYRQVQAEAPIRENLAALMWSYLPLLVTAQDLIVDPFCGSGTLLFEFLLKARPMFIRNYSFLSWGNTPALLKSPTFSKNFLGLENQLESFQLIGIDSDSTALEKAQRNFKTLSSHCALKSSIAWTHANCKDVRLPHQSRETLVIVANPPYGERLQDDGAMLDLAVFIDNNTASFKDAVLMVLQPLNKEPQFNTLGLKAKIPFNNQGLKLNLLIYQKQA